MIWVVFALAGGAFALTASQSERIAALEKRVKQLEEDYEE